MNLALNELVVPCAGNAVVLLGLTAREVADIFVGTTAIVSGVAVIVVVVVRWGFFAQTKRARAISAALGEGAARAIYVGLGAVLIGLGIWVLRG